MSVGKRIVSALKRFSQKLENDEPLNVKTVQLSDLTKRETTRAVVEEAIRKSKDRDEKYE